MKILMISMDTSILKEGSSARKRMIEYGKLVEEMHIIVLNQKSSAAADKNQNYNLKFKNENLNNIFLYPTNSMNRWFYVFDAYKIAKKIIHNSKFIIHNSLITCQALETGLAGWLVKRKYKIPLQLQIHTDFLSPFFWKESLLNKIRVLLAKFLVPRADCVRVVSKRVKDSLRANGYKLKANPVVLPVFVDVEKTRETPVAIDLRKKYPQFNFIILMASRLTKEKNIGLAISAMAGVVKKYPKAGLVIAGDGPEFKNLKSQILNLKTTSQNSNLDKQIIFEKWQGQEILFSYYKTADLFLLTSNYEGYGMAVVEAMAAGCPVVMTDVGLAGEVLVNKKDGLVIPVGNSEKLTEAIFNLIENSALRNNLINNSARVIDLWPTKEEYLRCYYNSFRASIF